MKTLPSLTGQPLSRLEGHAKVTGAAKYAGEYNVDGLLYGYVINSTITKGKIKNINTNEAKAQAGVLEVFTHQNSPSRAITAVAAGKIINPKTAKSQVLGGMVWGISKALREETILDNNLGKFMNQNLAEYQIPVHADVHDLDVIFVEEKDEVVNNLGVKGVGEIGIVAMPAAIANAIYHATGKRINKFPIYFDKLMS